MKKYQIELTDKQLSAISHACETCARINMVQLDMIAEYIGEGMLMKEFCNIRDILSKAQSEIQSIHTPQNKSEETHILWDIYQSARYKLSWDKLKAEGKTKPDFFGVSYDKPFKTSVEPLIKIKDVEKEII